MTARHGMTGIVSVRPLAAAGAAAFGVFLGLLATGGATSASADGGGVEAGDPKAGREHVRICLACHQLRPGMRRTGPSLFGIVGRPAGGEERFNYSDAMREADFDWTPERLEAFLADPEAVVPGTRMAFPGINDPQARADLVAYLGLLKDE